MRQVIALTAVVVLLAGCTSPAKPDPAGTDRSASPATVKATSTSGIRKVEPAQAVSLIKAGASLVVDVRTPAEYMTGHVRYANNINVDAADFESSVGRLPKDRSIVVYCKSGNRSAKAVERMKDMGFTNVADAGGFDKLAEAGAPTESGGGNPAPAPSGTGGSPSASSAAPESSATPSASSTRS